MRKNSFIEGAMVATIGIVISKILGILYVIPFYNIIGQKGGNLYGYAYSMYSIFLNLSSIGIPLAISRLTSEYNATKQYKLKERTFKIGKKIILILSIVSFVLLFTTAPLIAELFIGDIQGGNTKEDVAFVIRIISSAILIVPILSITKGYLQGHKYITVSTISQVLEQISRVLIIIVGSYVAIKVLDLPVKAGVDIAVFGATVGGLIAYIYLLIKMRKNIKHFEQEDDKTEENTITTKSIVKKILSYAIPFVFVSLITSFYSFVDLSTVIKVMVNNLKYTVNDAELVLSIFSTWGNKLNMIVLSVSTGLVTSLIPNISSSFAKNDLEDARNKINKSLQMLLYLVVPMTVGICLLSTPIWTIFYGYDILSSNIFAFYIFIALFSSLLTILTTILQFLNEYKKLFLYVLFGLLTKLVLNIPLMYLFNSININAGHGATLSTILGFLVTIILILIHLHKKIGVDYTNTLKKLLSIIFACSVMVVVIIILKNVLPLNVESRSTSLLAVAFLSAIGASTYLFITIKKGLLTDIFGNTVINKFEKRRKGIKNEEN